jgi:hypothetical protein
MNNADAADALQQHEEARRQREQNAKRYPPMPVKPLVMEPWRPVMTEQQRKEHEQYVQDHNLPF